MSQRRGTVSGGRPPPSAKDLGKKADVKLIEIAKTFERMKTLNPALQDVVKCAQRHGKMTAGYVESGAALNEAIFQLGSHHTGDMGRGIQWLSESITTGDKALHNAFNKLTEHVVVKVSEGARANVENAINKEREVKGQRQQQQQDLKRLEAASAKAGKKDPSKLQEMITKLNDKFTEVENFKTDTLKDVLLLERRMYCDFLAILNVYVDSMAEYHEKALKSLSEQEELRKELALARDEIPSDQMDKVMKQERTFVEVQRDAEAEDPQAPISIRGGGGSSLSTSTSYSYDEGDDEGDDYGSGSSAPPPPPAPPMIGGMMSNSPSSGGGLDDIPISSLPSLGSLLDDDSSGVESGGTSVRVVYAYTAVDLDELTVYEDEDVSFLEDLNDGWAKVRNSQGDVGRVPITYLDDM